MPGLVLQLPDLASHCNFTQHTNRFRKTVSSETRKWFFRNGHSIYMEKQCEAFNGLNPALLAAVCYPNAGYPQLRFCSDFLAYLFFLDNLSDDLDTRDTSSVANVILNCFYHPDTFESTSRIAEMSKNLLRRMRQTSTISVQRRFIETFDLFLQGVHIQARDRIADVVPSLESYIMLRRDTSGCRPCWAVIEYANNLDIPDEVMNHPVIQGLGDAANDVVAWSNDIFSYGVERSKGDTHNMIVIVMHHNNLEFYAAVEYVAQMCREALDRFIGLKQEIPTWGHVVDRDVEKYVQGLTDWIAGILHWSFETERYFGKSVRKVKMTRVVPIS